MTVCLGRCARRVPEAGRVTDACWAITPQSQQRRRSHSLAQVRSAIARLTFPKWVQSSDVHADIHLINCIILSFPNAFFDVFSPLPLPASALLLRSPSSRGGKWQSTNTLYFSRFLRCLYLTWIFLFQMTFFFFYSLHLDTNICT